ncbi:hypothetical protein D3C81_2325490 [compost metagenome]
MAKHKQGIARQRPGFGRQVGPAGERHHLPGFEHLQLDPGIVMQKQGTENTLMLLKKRAAGCG